MATKIDKRDDPSCKKKYQVTTEEGKKMKKQIGANAVIECSAKNGVGITEVLEMAVKVSFAGVQDKFQSSWCCFSKT